MNRTHFIRYFLITIFLTSVSILLPRYSVAVEIAGVTYSASAHANTTTGVNRQSGYTMGNCAHCHEQHASIGGAEPTPPVADGASPQLLFTTLSDNAACSYCHDSSGGAPDDIAAEMSKTYAHSASSVIYTDAARVLPAGPGYDGTLSCEKCHDSHYAQNTTHSEANDGNQIITTGPTQVFSGALLSMLGVRITLWTAGVITPEDMGSATKQEPSSGGAPLYGFVDKEYELCFKCHSGQFNAVVAGGGGARLDVHLQFNPNHFAVHPVATEGNPLWNNVHLRTFPGTAFQAGPWQTNPNAEMYCSDCHGSDTPATAPAGPHGSNNLYMLKYFGPGLSIDNLCLNCHNPFTVGGSSNWNDQAAWGNPSGGIGNGHDYPQHQLGAQNPVGCVACHGDIGDAARQSNIHGANYTYPSPGGGFSGRQSKQFTVSTYITQNYYNTVGGDVPGQRYCTSTCHITNAPNGPTYIY